MRNKLWKLILEVKSNRTSAELKDTEGVQKEGSVRTNLLNKLTVYNNRQSRNNNRLDHNNSRQGRNNNRQGRNNSRLGHKT